MWPELSALPAMKIGKSTSINQITTLHWQKMATECRIGWPMLRDKINELIQKIAIVLEQGELTETSNDPIVARNLTATVSERIGHEVK